MSILNVAKDLLSSQNRSTRARRFETEAQHILQTLTGYEDPQIDDEVDSTDDQDWLPEPFEIKGSSSVSLATMQRIIDMLDGTNGQRKRTHDGVRSIYQWYDPRYASRFRKILAEGGSRRDKMRALDAAVLEKFRQARTNRLPVHGRMIQRWALQFANHSSILNFTASTRWLHNFKRRSGIVSRKVTLYTSRSERDNHEEIVASIQRFKQEHGAESRQFPMDRVWNFDQTGFNYEPANLRTLSFKGERDTTLLLDSRNKHTHSYTVQPLISRSGRLWGF